MVEIDPMSKQYFHVLLAGLGFRLIKVLLLLKRPFVWMLGILGRLMRGVFGIAITPVIPAVRGYGVVQREAKKLSRSSKNTLMAFATHRYVIHVIVVSVVFSVIGLNMQTSQVRAETFGEKSEMYRLVAGERQPIIEEYAINAEQIEAQLGTGGLDGTALSAFNRGIESPLTVGSNPQGVALGTISSAPGTQTSGSVAPRTTIETYVVQSGDTLGIIAERFGISSETLLWANNLTSRSTIRPGDELKILPVTGVTHTVKSGDTLSRIANTYGVTVEEITTFNVLGDGSLGIGETLIIPGGTPPRTVATRPTTTTTTTKPTAPITSPTNAPASTATPSSGGMIWPTDLRIITQHYGWSHTGIDIDCHYTNYNYAAADGTVTYSGWRNGYGYTVEIDHGNGLSTRYAHHQSLAVSSGQAVTQGQPLGVCGTTGRSTGTHLHFEVMIGGRFQNPLSYIR